VKPAAWRAAVLRSPTITDSVRVLLLVLAENMLADGTVSVPRSELARTLGRNERRITERVAAAVGAGYLRVVSVGRQGRTAVYSAALPRAVRGVCPMSETRQLGCGLQPPRRVRTSAPYWGADGGPASSTRDQPDHGALPDLDDTAPGNGQRAPTLLPSLPSREQLQTADAAHFMTAELLAFPTQPQQRTIMKNGAPP
jgi:hypothetical protein